LRDHGNPDRAIEIGLQSLALQEHLTGLDMNRRLAVLESEHREQETARREEADAALYRAKAAGRDQVRVAHVPVGENGAEPSS